MAIAASSVVAMFTPFKSMASCRARTRAAGAGRAVPRRDGSVEALHPNGACAVYPEVEVVLDQTLILSPDQPAPHRPVEDLVGGTQVLAERVGFPDHVGEEADVAVLAAVEVFAGVEVVHGHVAGLSVAVESAVPLFQPRRVPRTVVVEQVASGPVEVEPLGSGVGGDQDAHFGVGIVERGLDAVPLGRPHAGGSSHAKQGEDPVRRILPSQPVGEVVQRGLVLGEDDEPFVVAESAIPKQQPVDQPDQCFETRVAGGLLVGDGRAIGLEPEAGDRLLDAADLRGQLFPVVPEPSAHDRGSRRLALLRLPVVSRFLAKHSFRHLDIGFRGGLFGHSLQGSVPRVGERRRARQKTFAEYFHREGACAAASLCAGTDEPSHRRAEFVEGGR